MDRLTDSKVAAELKSNYEGLKRVGIEPSVMDLHYIKLAAYENAEEDAEKLCEDMQALIDDRDPERAHGQADDILCKALNNFGCHKLTEIYDKVDKWYS